MTPINSAIVHMFIGVFIFVIYVTYKNYISMFSMGDESMKKYFFIGFGGALGAILRFIIEYVQISNHIGNLPINTLVINTIGSFVLAMTYSIAYEANENLKLAITVGFLGAFTTFSTMCKEAVKLINNGQFYSSIFYLFISVALGLGMAYLGNITGKNIAITIISIKNNRLEIASDYNLKEGDEI